MKCLVENMVGHRVLKTLRKTMITRHVFQNEPIDHVHYHLAVIIMIVKKSEEGEEAKKNIHQCRLNSPTVYLQLPPPLVVVVVVVTAAAAAIAIVYLYLYLEMMLLQAVHLQLTR